MKDLRFSPKTLQQICDKHNLGKIQNLSYSQSGMVNPCVFINDAYVIRFNVRDPQIPKFRREKMAMELLKENKILVPEVIALDESRTILPHDFLICKRIKGKELYQVWETLEEKIQMQLCSEMGEILAKIHQVYLPKFGAILPDGLQFETWSACILHKLQLAIEEAKTLQLFEERMYQKVQQIFDNHTALLDTVKNASLVHNDYHLGNVIVNEGHIAGILDFEWCFAGDPEYDFREPLTFEGVTDKLLLNYQKYRPLSAEYPPKSHLYRLLLYLQLSVLATMHNWGEESTLSYRKRFEEILGSFD
ncbi:MAG: phosphotransferase family protein [Chitinophagales bacterium]